MSFTEEDLNPEEEGELALLVQESDALGGPLTPADEVWKEMGVHV